MTAVRRRVDNPDAWISTSTTAEFVHPAWMSHGSCVGVDPDVFVPGIGENATLAIRICASCDVRRQCLDYAIEHREHHGVWGGLTPRARLRRSRKLRGAA